MKTVNISGKDYVMVDERLKEFHRKYPNGSVETFLNVDTEFLTYHTREASVFIVRAKVTPDVSVPERFTTGHAYEVEGSSFINEGSALENCETSAVGRALGMLGIGLIGGVASADEVQNAVANQKPKTYYNPDGKPSNTSRLASEKQIDYIDSLKSEFETPTRLNEVMDWMSDKFEIKDVENPTSFEASKMIEHLKVANKNEDSEQKTDNEPLPF